nr:hypothetical protein [Tanacetum cinerariifolium]
MLIVADPFNCFELHRTILPIQRFRLIQLELNSIGLDPTYNGVQFKLYEMEALNWEGGPMKFETVKWIPPGIFAKIHVLMKRKSSLDDLFDPHIASVEGYISGLKDSVYSFAGIADL